MWGYSRGAPGGPPVLDVLLETIGMNMGLDSITWVEIITINSPHGENVGVSVGLDNITWEGVP